MTTVAEGYPDWQRVETRALNPLVRTTIDTLGNPFSTGMLFVANFPCLIVQGNAGGTSIYNATLQWYTDSDKSNSLLTEQIGLAGNTWPYRVAHGVVSPWLDMFITPLTYVAGDTVALSLTPSTFQIPQIQLSYNYLVRQTGVSIAAGATTTFNANAIIPGPGILYMHTADATSWSLNMQVLESDGNWHSSFFDESTVTATTVDFNVTLPPRPTRLQIHNRGAGAASFDTSLSSWAQ